MQIFLRAQQVLESSFSPYECHCRLEANDTLTIHIVPPGGGAAALLVAGVSRSEWQSDEALDRLIAELSSELLEAQQRST